MIIVKVSLYYYNTGSTKRILALFRKLDEVYKKAIPNGATMKIIWQFESNDEDTKFDGEAMAKMVSVPFEIVEVPEE